MEFAVMVGVLVVSIGLGTACVIAVLSLVLFLAQSSVRRLEEPGKSLVRPAA
jgi:hypothetical protein